ncbi:ABC transporter permease [uncultured Serinicoccus sp.]|uniref:ABC transporter permease n=1 Tax=uncultured Serinicoccus sp. TaxID=735514 RepID=UPI00261DF432|nr:ABC transporter permease [uncultured Serinicoccus sp.]
MSTDTTHLDPSHGAGGPGPEGSADGTGQGAARGDDRASGTAYPWDQGGGSRADERGLPFTRLLRTELRKTVDTRGGRWLLVVIAALTVLATGLAMWLGRDAGATYPTLLTTAVLPQAVLLPVLGILTAASEWSQRTALVTFTQEPRRLRVMAAKTLAALGLGLLVVALTLGLAALAHVASVSLAGGDVDLSVPWHLYVGVVALQVVYVLMGVAFGALLLNVPLAIAAFFALPVLISLATMSIGWLGERSGWIDPNVAAVPFTAVDQAPTTEQWQQLGVTTVWWVLIPLALGLWRVARREVK